jgi:putative ABC transport system substrate-binding protein
MDRRAFLGTLAGALLATPLAAAQQPSTVTRVGFFYFGSRQSALATGRYAAFLDGMRELGYVEGKNLIIEARFGDSRPDRLPELAAELVRLKVDVIVAIGSPTYRVLQRTPSIPPIVITVTFDPVIEGLAASMARPGGNFTGLSDTAADLGPKQLELFRAVLPKLSRVGVLLNPDNVSHPAQMKRPSSPASPRWRGSGLRPSSYSATRSSCSTSNRSRRPHSSTGRRRFT